MLYTNKTAKREKTKTNRTRARQMRHDPVAMEEFFWSKIRNRKLGGFKFKRQVLIGSYIADFVCVEYKLVVELDGPLHTERKEYDERRDKFLRKRGYRVFRFTNSELGDDAATTLQIILHALKTPSP